MLIPHASYTNPEKRIIIISGAGLSAESGISTFRDSDGLWENHKITDVCHEMTWKNNWELVHKFYNDRRVQLASVEPNEAHKTISRIKEKYKDECYVITQNVDDLLERAGVNEVLHLHGNLKKMECISCAHNWDIEYKKFDTETDRCPKCNSKKGVRPSIVFFGGQAPMYNYMHRALEYLENKESVLIIVGTMGNVISFQSLISRETIKGNQVAHHKTVRARTILNNLEENEYFSNDIFDETFYEKATTALPKIEKWLEENY